MQPQAVRISLVLLLAVASCRAVTVVDLDEGIVTRVEEATSECKYYVFSTSTVQNVSAWLTPFSGDPNVAMKIFPNPNAVSNALPGDCKNWGGNAGEWSSRNSDGYDIIQTVSPAGDTAYGVGVWTDSKAMFSLVRVTDKNTKVHLVPLQPQVYRVLKGQSVVFKAPAWTNVDDTVEISVTPLFGDPDVYVSAPFTTLTPSPTLYNWRHTALGADVLKINKNSSPAGCAGQGDACGWNAVGEGAFFMIGVYGYQDAEFVITFGDDSKPFILATSINMAGQVVAKQDGMAYEYYKVLMADPTHDMDIFLTKKYGDGHVYVNRATQSSPTKVVQDFAGSIMDEYSEFVSLTSANSGDRNAVYVSVGTECTGYCYSTLFTVLAHDHSYSIILQNGLDQSGKVAPSEPGIMYRLFYDDPAADVNFSLRRASSNTDADLYIKFGEPVGKQKSIEGAFDAKGSRWGDEEVRVLAADIEAKKGPGWRGWIYAEVVGFYSGSGQFNYTLTASSSVAPRSLTFGEPANESTNKVRYYQIEVGNQDVTAGPADLAIMLTTYSGSSTLVVAPPADDGNPSVARPVLDSPAPVQKFESKTMLHTMPYKQGTWTIGLFPTENVDHTVGTTAFSLVLYTLGDAVPLRSGMPLAGKVRPGQYTYFKYDMTSDLLKPEHPNFQVSLNVYGSDDADVYMSTSEPRPTKDTPDAWKGERYGNDDYIIHYDDPLIKRGNILYIGVAGYHGDGDISFTITVSLPASHTTLVNGRAFSGSTNKGLTDYFQYRPVSPTWKVTVSFLRGRAVMWVSKKKQLNDPNATTCAAVPTDCEKIVAPEGQDSLVYSSTLAGELGYTSVNIGITQDGDDYQSIGFTVVAIGMGLDGIIQLNAGSLQYGQSPDKKDDTSRAEDQVYELSISDRSSGPLTLSLVHQKDSFTYCKDHGHLGVVVGRSYDVTTGIGGVVPNVDTTVSTVDINILRVVVPNADSGIYYVAIQPCKHVDAYATTPLPFSVYYSRERGPPVTIGEGRLIGEGFEGVYRYRVDRERSLGVSVTPCVGQPTVCVSDVSATPVGGTADCNIASAVAPLASVPKMNAPALKSKLHEFGTELYIGVSGKDARYQLCVSQSDKDDCAAQMEETKYLFAGSQILVTDVTDSSVTISWQAATRKDGTPGGPAGYAAFITSMKDPAVPYTNCGLWAMKRSKGLPAFSPTTFTQRFDGLNPGSKYILAVAAEEGVSGNYSPFPPTAVTTTGVAPDDDDDHHGRHGGGFWAGVGWFLFTVILLVTIALAVYCVGGILYKRLNAGARGFEQIPNSDFWREVPSKVTSGIGSLFKKGAPKPGAGGARTYDRMIDDRSEYVPPNI